MGMLEQENWYQYRWFCLAVLVWSISLISSDSLAELPTQGQLVPELSDLDELIQSFLRANDVSGGLVAVRHQGELVFHRSYGWRDQDRQQQLAPDAMMRVASLSKPITAAAVRKLIERGDLNLKDRVFNLTESGGILDVAPFPLLGDERYESVTIDHLLRHRGGWDRWRSGDFVWHDLDIARAMELDRLPRAADKVDYILGKPLDVAPGSTRIYSNIGYLILGEVIETVTGKDYLDAVHELVISPLGIPRGEIIAGNSLPEDRSAREPWYAAFGRVENVFDPEGPWVPFPDGGWNLSSTTAFGGLVASTKAISRIGDNYIQFGDDTGRPRTGAEGANFVNAHSGLVRGAESISMQVGNDVSFALMLNKSAAALADHTFSGDLIPQIRDLLREVVEWPAPISQRGDVDGDGWLTSGDVEAFSQALLAGDEAEFVRLYPDGQWKAADGNEDSSVTIEDLPLLETILRTSHEFSPEAFQAAAVIGDANRDWKIDIHDLEVFCTPQSLNSTTNIGLVLSLTNRSPGDVNFDGAVDFSDFARLSHSFGMPGGWYQGDLDCSGAIGFGDFVVLSTNYDQPGAAAVPEPSTTMLPTILLPVVLVTRRGRIRGKSRCITGAAKSNVRAIPSPSVRNLAPGLGCVVILAGTQTGHLRGDEVFNNLHLNAYSNAYLFELPLVVDSGRRIAQQFQITNQNQIDSVTLSLGRSGLPSGTLAVEVWSDDGRGRPADWLATIGELDVDLLPQGDLGLFTFTDSVPVPTDTPFQLVLSYVDVESTVIPEALVIPGTVEEPDGANGADELRIGRERSDRIVWARPSQSRFTPNQAYLQMSVSAVLRGDFDGDGLITANDVDLLSKAIRTDSSSVEFDLNEDGTLDFRDRETWLNRLANATPGDTNLDGEVNFADFTALSASMGDSGGWAMGNFNVDPVVDFQDFIMLSSNYRPDPKAMAVPESSSGILSLFVLGCAVATLRRNRLFLA